MSNLLLLELEHQPFENWFIRLFQQDLLPTGKFSIMDMRHEYLRLCWREEELWQKWSENAQTENKW